MLAAGALVGECVGGVQGADVPGQRVCGVVEQVGQVVREGAAMQRVAIGADVLPQGCQLVSGGG
ncbi:hypothetical protein GCM10027089_61430 [Nocardia thraciensis]